MRLPCREARVVDGGVLQEAPPAEDHRPVGCSGGRVVAAGAAPLVPAHDLEVEVVRRDERGEMAVHLGVSSVAPRVCPQLVGYGPTSSRVAIRPPHARIAEGVGPSKRGDGAKECRHGVLLSCCLAAWARAEGLECLLKEERGRLALEVEINGKGNGRVLERERDGLRDGDCAANCAAGDRHCESTRRLDDARALAAVCDVVGDRRVDVVREGGEAQRPRLYGLHVAGRWARQRRRQRRTWRSRCWV